MRLTILFLIGVALALIQFTTFANWPTAPDLILAFAAWTMVAGPVETLLPRTWLLGLAADLVCPGTGWYHMVLLGTGALWFMPLRSLLYHSRPVAWLLGGTGLVAWDLVLHRLCFGWAPVQGGSSLVVWLNTGIAILIIGWIGIGIPERWHPLGRLRA